MIDEPCPIFRSVATLKTHVERAGAKRVVLANGCFDPLHAGHVRYLSGAKVHGDFLVVAVNDDKSARTLTGKSSLVMPVAGRSRLIAALKMVDAVLIFSARNASGVLKSLRPAVHAKETDQTDETTRESDTARTLGVDTVIVGDPEWRDTSALVKRIRRSRDRRGGTEG